MQYRCQEAYTSLTTALCDSLHGVGGPSTNYTRQMLHKLSMLPHKEEKQTHDSQPDTPGWLERYKLLLAL